MKQKSRFRKTIICIIFAVCIAAEVPALTSCGFGNSEDTKRIEVVKINNVWTYVDENGDPDMSFSGIAYNELGNWLVENGRVNFNYTGPYYYNGLYHIIINGKDYS